MNTTRYRHLVFTVVTFLVFAMSPVVLTLIAHGTIQRSGTATTPIQHVVVIMEENHSFDNLFGRFPGANGTPLPRASNPLTSDFDHSGPATIAAIAGGTVNSFPLRGHYQYDQPDIPNSWAYAQQFGLGDNFFSSIATSSTPNHMAMLAAQSAGLNSSGSHQGCNSVQNNLFYSRDTTARNYWQYPCFNIGSLPGLLDTNHISWRYYSATSSWNPSPMISAITNDQNWTASSAQFIPDVQAGKLATVSWLTPPGGDPSDHPPSPLQGGENFITQQVNAIMQSQYWSSTAIFVTWDEWGGLYDHVSPPQIDGTGLGLRVPLLVISPYAKHNYISHAQSEFSSFVKFVEKDFNLPNLGERDALASTSDLMDFFDFSQKPQPPLVLSLLKYSQAIKVPSNGGLGGASAAFNPAVGSTSTTYSFDVIYTLSGTPAIHNVTIDGVNQAMTAKGPSSGGVLYEYRTKLGVGSHSFTFTFSDTSGTLTLPYNGVPFAGPEVHPFNLGGGAVQPSQLLSGNPVTYSITYKSPTNTPPTLAEVDIDGIAHNLQAHGSNYKTGVVYTYTTSSLSVGVHYYRYRFDDGSGVAILEESEKPIIAPLVLTNSSVNPTSGTTSTVFTFQTTYADGAGNKPAQANLYVDNKAYPMSFVSGSYSTGALFQVKTTLPSGNHSFFFVFSDKTSSWADPIAPVTYAGPNVGVNAQPVAPGTLIYPSHDDDPDVDLPSQDQ